MKTNQIVKLLKKQYSKKSLNIWNFHLGSAFFLHSPPPPRRPPSLKNLRALHWFVVAPRAPQKEYFDADNLRRGFAELPRHLHGATARALWHTQSHARTPLPNLPLPSSKYTGLCFVLCFCAFVWLLLLVYVSATFRLNLVHFSDSWCLFLI